MGAWRVQLVPRGYGRPRLGRGALRSQSQVRLSARSPGAAVTVCCGRGRPFGVTSWGATRVRRAASRIYPSSASINRRCRPNQETVRSTIQRFGTN